MPARRRDAQAVSPWLWTVLAVVVYAGLTTALFAFDLRVELGLPAAAVLAPPVALYALVVFLAQPRFRPVGWVLGVVATLGAHAALVVVASGLDVALGGRSWSPAAVLALVPFAPTLVLQLIFAPLALAPFRSVLTLAARSSRRRWGAAPGRPLPRVAAAPVPWAAAPAPATGVAGASAPAEMDALFDAAVPPVGIDAPGAAAVVEGSAAVAAPATTPAAETAAPPLADETDAPAAVDTVAPAVPDEACVRVRFERVAAQLPPALFTAPPADVAALLAEPGHLLVPCRLVVPQLADGLVQVPWAAVAGQFPRTLRAASDAKVREALGASGLVLPLDEIVPQLPPDVFAMSSRAVDVRRLEEFPLPFQPPAASPAVDEAAGPPADAWAAVAAGDAPAADSVEPAPVDAATVAEPALVAGPSTDAHAGATDADAAAMDSEAEATAPSAAPRVVPLPARRDEARRVAATLLPATGTVEVDAYAVGGVPVLSVGSPGLAADAVARTVARALPVLVERRAPGPLAQVTLRGARGAVVLTPLGPREHGAPVLVVALVPGASLALLELLALRATGGAGGGDAAAEPLPADAGFVPAAADAALAGVAGTLGAFGAVVPSVLRHADGGLDLFLFTAADRAVTPVARAARELFAAAVDGAALGAVSSIAFRGAREQVLATPLAARRPALLVAAGVVRRPGLARLQLGRAAAALGATAV